MDKRSFPLPPKQKIREEYTIEVENFTTKPGTWKQSKCIISRNLPDGTKQQVFSYERNYALGRTFEPFRQLRDGKWHDYALISSRYTRFEIVDLQLGKIIATEEYSKFSQERYDMYVSNGWQVPHEVGDDMPESGFCPVEFRVFDWRDKFKNEDVNRSFEIRGEERFAYTDKQLHGMTGQWALYSGCYWGDDSSWKLRYIDLSRIREGIVTADERFGYVPLAQGLKDITYMSESDGFILPVELIANRVTGKVNQPEIKWASEEEELEW